jgi:DNA-binding response OmpR family regulator
MPRPEVDLSGARILAVDDVPANLEILFHTLERAGYNVHVAADGMEALHVAATTPPDLILLDVMMPGIDGYETCRRLRQQSALDDVPILFLTARDDLAGVLEGFEAGGVDYISKPFRKEEVLMRIRTHLERERFARHLAEINAHLEDKVAERTEQLRLSLRQLQARDGLLRHMLRLPPLTETLDVVLQTVTQLLDVPHAAVHLTDGGGLRLAARLGSAPSPATDLVDEARERRTTCTRGGAAVVPLHRGDHLLGLIEVERPDADLTVEQLSALDGVALEAAVALHDAQLREDPDSWDDRVDELADLTDALDGALDDALDGDEPTSSTD